MDKQKLIEDCKEEIQHLEARISKPYSQRHPEHQQYLESQFVRQKIVLASLEVEPVGYVSAKHLAELKGGELGYIVPNAAFNEMPVYLAPPAQVVNKNALRELVDVVWQEATESEAVPSTKWADSLIDKLLSLPPEPVSSRYETPTQVVKVPDSIGVRTAIKDLEQADMVTTIAQAYKMAWNACRAEVLRLNNQG
ncbi:hypothetical protein P0E69_09380 [Chimaeribacter arupi]|uniref:hypothetical protein n=1 Tax=Chimaeribacter arupi TaxID=2060066 RepID=UPI002711F30A|nr:hypothetical protein [Chimaeribacter arupi]WKZ94058.1 hypothetical protein P0E69_09380 [Chimaeribacter arupi]